MPDPIREYMKEKDIGICLFLNSEPANANFSYLSGFNGQGALVVTKTKKALLVPEPEYHIAKKETRGIPIVNLGGKRISEYVNKHHSSLVTGGIALDHHSLSAEQFFAVKKALKARRVIDVWPAVREMRMRKTPAEIARITKACEITEQILLSFQKKIRTFTTEADAAAYLSFEAGRHAGGPSFPPIVASGKNAGKWHHTPEKVKIAEGFCIVDFGVWSNGYCSDITRTFFLGKPSERERERYELVRKVQEDAIARMIPGADLGEIQEEAKNRLGPLFVHSLGHGIGREVHEGPHFMRKQRLEEGMALAVEPAIYKPYSYGIRIEDDVLIRKGGAERLTEGTRKLILL